VLTSRRVPGTDGPAGFTLHRDLELYAKAGIANADVLALATLGSAKVMGRDDRLGSIEPGKLADLVLIDGDPLADMSAIRRTSLVMKGGTIYDPAALFRAVNVLPMAR
jgi:imidazolonepropionase-like amidohydrolase